MNSGVKSYHSKPMNRRPSAAIALSRIAGQGEGPPASFGTRSVLSIRLSAFGASRFSQWLRKPVPRAFHHAGHNVMPKQIARRFCRRQPSRRARGRGVSPRVLLSAISWTSKKWPRGAWKAQKRPHNAMCNQRLSSQITSDSWRFGRPIRSRIASSGVFPS
jgi:hypothetical protein